MAYELAAETLIAFGPNNMAMTRRWVLDRELDATLDYYEKLHGQRPTIVSICNFCEKPIQGEPVRDSEEIFWRGKANARTWCNDTCVQSDAERGF